VRSSQRERESGYAVDWDEGDDSGDESDGKGAYLMRGDVGISSIHDDLFNMREEDGDDRDESDEEDDEEVGLPIRLQHLAICPRHVSHSRFRGRLVVHEQCYPHPRPSRDRFRSHLIAGSLKFIYKSAFPSLIRLGGTSRHLVTLKEDVGAVQLPELSACRKVMPGLVTLPALRMYLGASYTMKTETEIWLERIRCPMSVRDGYESLRVQSGLTCRGCVETVTFSRRVQVWRNLVQ
jgi:hypothetical protein